MSRGDCNTVVGVGEPRYHRLTVKAVRAETAEARSFVLAPERGDSASFRYLPGQFLSFRIPHADGQVVRCYSLSSAPCADPDMTVCVKRVANGLGSNWFHDHLSVGARIEATAPSGRFVLNASDAPVLLVAGGSGITPCLALIKQLLSETNRRVKILYANQNSSSIIYRDNLSQLQSRFAERFTCRHWLDDKSGFLTGADVEAETVGWTESECYVCGPAPLMELAEDSLVASLGSGTRILSERFVAQGGGKSKHSTAEADTAKHTESFMENFRVILDGEEREVPIGVGETLLQALRGAGIDAPYSCIEGHCGTCMARLCSGEVSMTSTQALSKRNIAHGLVLACQATPASSAQLLLNFDF